jgi:hypothetical protein
MTTLAWILLALAAPLVVFVLGMLWAVVWTYWHPRPWKAVRRE